MLMEAMAGKSSLPWEAMVISVQRTRPTNSMRSQARRKPNPSSLDVGGLSLPRSQRRARMPSPANPRRAMRFKMR